MEFIKEEIEDMTDPEPSRIKHEDEQQTGCCALLIRPIVYSLFMLW